MGVTVHGNKQTPAWQIQLYHHALPTTHPHHPTHLPPWCLKHCSFRDYLEISFCFQNIPERGVAFQVATFGHQYTWENGFVWEMRGSECLTSLVCMYYEYSQKLRLTVKGGFFRPSESAETWSTMVSTSSSVEKCTIHKTNSLSISPTQ